MGKSWSDNGVLSTSTGKHLKATRTGKLANHLYMGTSKGNKNGEIGQPPVQSNHAVGWGNLGRTTAIGNGETGQRPVQSNPGGGWNRSCKHLKATRTRTLGNHLCSHIGQVVGEMLVGQQCTRHSQIGQMARKILVGQLCTKHRYEQIFEGNRERGNWPTTYAVKSGRWLLK
ncbi:unnamed protein product [Prunus armeniaca]